ncbi:hypothetical protein T12_12357 [Trichinella patagoniensis]|uniref:Uncharacterized protein n=1 Tax=Trichinella patagoniensis TaxID=990121 RepID=A0A0V1A2M0_9BILA|nr:hypothetical protein T12_12357 [Trichinella patagoniensis]
MESTSYAIFLCTRHNAPGNFSYKHDIIPGKSAQDNVLALFILKVSGGYALRPVRMVSRGQWNSLGAIPCVITKLRQQQGSVHLRINSTKTFLISNEACNWTAACPKYLHHPLMCCIFAESPAF